MTDMIEITEQEYNTTRSEHIDQSTKRKYYKGAGYTSKEFRQTYSHDSYGIVSIWVSRIDGRFFKEA